MKNKKIELTEEEYGFVLNDIKTKILNSEDISFIEFKLCDNQMKNDYIQNGGHLSPLALIKCDKDLKKKYMEIYTNYNWIDDSYFIQLDSDTQNLYAEILLEEDEAEITETQFSLIKDEFKIKYIMNHGFVNLSKYVKDWWNIWSKAKKRENIINSILTD